MLVLQDPELLEARALPRREQPDAPHRRDDLGEQVLAEELLRLVVEGDALAFLHREAELLPHLLEQEAIPHQAGGLVDEVLALGDLGGGHVAIHVGEGQHAVRDVTRLVADHVIGDRPEERLEHRVARHAERRERQALDHDLHAEQLHVPARVLEDEVEQRLQVRAYRIGEADLLAEVPVKDLDVTPLVDDLRRRVQLGAYVRHGVHELRGGEQRALLAMEELRLRPGRQLRPHLLLLLLGQPPVQVRAEQRVERLGKGLTLQVHVGRPVEVLAVPLRGLGLAVEVTQIGAALAVVPVQGHVHRDPEVLDVGRCGWCHVCSAPLRRGSDPSLQEA